MTESKITSIGQLMTEKLETIGLPSSIQQASTKMRDKNVSSLVVVDDYNKPIVILFSNLYMPAPSNKRLLKLHYLVTGDSII